MKYTEYLSTLSKYPQSDEIDEASNKAQDKATEELRLLDADATLTVDEGECYIKSEILDSEGCQNIQTIFDEEFAEQIEKMGYEE